MLHAVHGEQFCGLGAARSLRIAFPIRRVAFPIRCRPRRDKSCCANGTAVLILYAYPLGLQNVFYLCSTIWVRELAIDFYCG